MHDVLSFNWPKKGNRAFSMAVDRASPALLPCFIFATSGVYAVGFKSAADKIIEGIDMDRNPDVYFFPVAYLYRHYLELTLKNIVDIGRKAGAITVPQEQLRTHNLHELWNLARKLIGGVSSEEDMMAIDAIQSVILEFHQLDERGDAFRYSTDNRGNRHLINAPEWISLATLKNTMDAVANFLEAAEAIISV